MKLPLFSLYRFYIDMDFTTFIAFFSHCNRTNLPVFYHGEHECGNRRSECKNYVVAQGHQCQTYIAKENGRSYQQVPYDETEPGISTVFLLLTFMDHLLVFDFGGPASEDDNADESAENGDFPRVDVLVLDEVAGCQVEAIGHHCRTDAKQDWSGRHDARRCRETRNEKNFSRFLDGAARMALMRALK